MKWLIILTMVVLAFSAPADMLLIDEQVTAAAQRTGQHSVNHQIDEASIVWHRCPKSADDAKPISTHCSSDTGILTIGSAQSPVSRPAVSPDPFDAIGTGASSPPLIRPPNPLA